MSPGQIIFDRLLLIFLGGMLANIGNVGMTRGGVERYWAHVAYFAIGLAMVAIGIVGWTA